ncbi:MAG TPA: tRNA (adenosine(37)-N6)-threonylcarbamoyltransferase complex ATPase subunit type 1 TsaE [Candidatus Treponema faecavium]|nr:tRNA (adenosine(37)-N6)-threonylcarbamoyltransferase complex ATPase subunit type 1 TsaE [Candidatus Treponema faecavium]
MITVITHSAEETIELGRRIGTYLQRGDVIALQGTLAAGKTTITKGIAQALGVEEAVTSPTFTLISEYDGRLHLYHMDVYRLDSTDDFLNLGVEDMLYGDGVCIIEWSEKVQTVLPQDTVIITLESQQDNSRKITVQNWKYGALTL